jgi:DNA gyrase subunit B
LTVINPDDKDKPRLFEGERLKDLMALLDGLEKHLQIVERRGLSVAGFFNLQKNAELPTYRVLLGGQEHWFFTLQERDAFIKEEQQRQGKELVVAEEATAGNGQGNGHTDVYSVQELHEVRDLNTGLKRLREDKFGVLPADLVPAPRIAGREPEPRFFLENGDHRKVLPHLRELVAEVRKIGERGLAVTRFKGLGEMDGEELWETTLDPAKRTLLCVHLEDALKADEMFRVLMGDKVEPRRDFIQKYALEVKEIDYHGA